MGVWFVRNTVTGSVASQGNTAQCGTRTIGEVASSYHCSNVCLMSLFKCFVGLSDCCKILKGCKEAKSFCKRGTIFPNYSHSIATTCLIPNTNFFNTKKLPNKDKFFWGCPAICSLTKKLALQILPVITFCGHFWEEVIKCKGSQISSFEKEEKCKLKGIPAHLLQPWST